MASRPIRPLTAKQRKDLCKGVTPQELCEYLSELQKWIWEVQKLMRGIDWGALQADYGGPGGGTPSDPPTFP